MGGGGDYYDRDVSDRATRTSRGFTASAERELSRSMFDPSTLPKGRRLRCLAKNPIFGAFDGTGSMGDLPMIYWDKAPMTAGQLVEQAYLPDPMMCLSVVGDIVCDKAGIQIGEFVKIRELDTWLKRLWLEGGGGGQDVESYEMHAYFAARMIDMPNATLPFCVFTGDEGFRETLNAADLNEHFGGEHRTVSAKTVFTELREKFKDNVYLIHRAYTSGDDAAVVRQWEGVLGAERVVRLGEDTAIADVTLGLFALRSGKRTLDQYLEDMRRRGQDESRVRSVRDSLAPLSSLPAVVVTKSPKKKSKGKPSKKAKPVPAKSAKSWKL